MDPISKLPFQDEATIIFGYHVCSTVTVAVHLFYGGEKFGSAVHCPFKLGVDIVTLYHEIKFPLAVHSSKERPLLRGIEHSLRLMAKFIPCGSIVTPIVFLAGATVIPYLGLFCDRLIQDHKRRLLMNLKI